MTFWDFLLGLCKAILDPWTLALIILTILLITGIINWSQVDHLIEGIHL